ncbi:hypothetical protein ADILRU_0002 [Leifsonia rubra CMS 76R]|nr:hypothetical protein ADILRU_0002 [Leifsonia rubra CMS 76R]
MRYTNTTAPRTRMRVALAAFLAALAMVVAPLVPATATAAETYTISGTLEAAGSDASVINVEIWNPESYAQVTVTLTDNSYTTEPLEPGTYQIFASLGSDWDSSKHAPYEAEVVISDSDVTHNIELLRWAFVRGSVTDLNNIGDSSAGQYGGPVPNRNIMVTAHSLDKAKQNWEKRVFISDADPSAYELRVAPGTYKIGFNSSAYSSTQYSPGVEDVVVADVLTLAPDETVPNINAMFPLGVVRLGGRIAMTPR